MTRIPLVARALLLGVLLLCTGFAVGLGFQSRASQQAKSQPAPTPIPTVAPLVKGLRASPDGRLLAFTGIYHNFGRGSVWVYDAQSGRAKATASPVGWQDYVAGWSGDGRTLLLEREKIPRPVAKAKAGIYRAPVDRGTLALGGVTDLTPDLPGNEKIVSGLYAPDGKIIIKTRSDPKALYRVEGKRAIPLDRAAVTYGQNRAVRSGQSTIFYVVRDIAKMPDKVALFRIAGDQTRQISPAFDAGEISWSYVSPQGKQLILARAQGEDWEWTLYRIEASTVKKLRSATVPGDVITVYWSPDEKRVLGAAGEKLWTIEVPSLVAKQLGARTDWNADDAAWIGNQNAVAVAAGGQLWRVEVPGGAAKALWRFPDPYWK